MLRERIARFTHGIKSRDLTGRRKSMLSTPARKTEKHTLETVSPPICGLSKSKKIGEVVKNFSDKAA